VNYLAHAYLNGTRSDEVLMGNMMGDFVKGKKWQLFDKPIQEGILLHRQIDVFTDVHPAVSRAKVLFRPFYGLYSGILTDTLFDYFLANDLEKFPNEQALEKFTNHIYEVIDQREHLMDEKMKYVTYHMKLHNWLYNYKNKEGIIRSFNGMAKRIFNLGNADKANEIFLNNQTELNECYSHLMNDLKNEFYK
jgi:acyl carrier protein phosphodiesterase